MEGNPEIIPDANQEDKLNEDPVDIVSLWKNLYPPILMRQIEESHPDRRRAPGGGRKPQTYHNESAQMLYNFYRQNKGKLFSEGMMQEMINMMRSETVKKEDIPPTIYHLEKAGDVLVPSTVCFAYSVLELTVKIPKSVVISSQELFFYQPEDIIAEILGSKGDTEGWVYKSRLYNLIHIKIIIYQVRISITLALPMGGRFTRLKIKRN